MHEEAMPPPPEATYQSVWEQIQKAANAPMPHPTNRKLTSLDSALETAENAAQRHCKQLDVKGGYEQHTQPPPPEHAKLPPINTSASPTLPLSPPTLAQHNGSTQVSLGECGWNAGAKAQMQKGR